ncbi:MAG: hypothetical protein N2Z63_02555 [Thiobacillaceae bacterium]|nr:hypothetical protein [Thiobacillaceae bacterium]
MNPISEEALALARMAEQDWEILQVIKDAPRVGVQGVCFHAQQCREIPQGTGCHPRWQTAAHSQPRGIGSPDRSGCCGLPCTVDELAELNPCAVVLRYDDQEFELLSRQEIVSRAERMRAWARDRLGLGVQGEAG